MKKLLAFWLILIAAQAPCFGAPAATATRGAGARGQLSADQILSSLPNGSGIAVCVGLAGDLPAQLAEKSGLLLQVLVREPAVAEATGRLFEERGLTGRAGAEVWTAPTLPYPENFANLIVLADPAAVPAAERLRVLAPGGVAWTRTGGAWAMVRKPRPKTFDDWTHWRHGADGNMVSDDKAVAVPQGVRWIASPPPWVTDNTGNFNLGMVSSGGRNFYNFKDTLVARDAYNGTLLWSRELDIPIYNEKVLVQIPKQNLARRTTRPQPIARGNSLYVISGQDILILDGATGKTRLTVGQIGDPYDMLIADNGYWVISHAGGIRTYDLTADPNRDIPVPAARLAWENPLKAQRIVSDGGAVFCIDGGQAVCLNMTTGEERWRSAAADAAQAGTLTYHDGVLVLEKSHLLNFLPQGTGMTALSAADGRVLWSRDYAPNMTHFQEARALFAQGLIWLNEKKAGKNQLTGLDPRTGAERQVWPQIGGLQIGGLHCSASIATERFFIAPECNFTDLVNGRTVIARMIRHACRIPFFPANGLLNTIPAQCECFPMLRGVMGMSPTVTKGVEGERLVRGAAAPAAQPAADPIQEWPTYRHDVWRSGATSCTVALAGLRPRWKTAAAAPAKGFLAGEWKANPFVGGPLTPPVAAGGLLVVAAPDAHRVIALDAATGEVRWTYTAGGRVDTPPTLHEGLCLFGAHDGWAYALDAASGALVWRFRAAPREARISAYGQVESLWPAVGSVLVDGGAAYVVAGRHPMSDGGVTVHALAPRTGEPIWSSPVDDLPLSRWYGGRIPEIDVKYGVGFRPVDLMMRDGDRVAMSRWRFDPASGKSQTNVNGPEYEALGRRVPRGLWKYGSLQGKFLDPKPAPVFDGEGLYEGADGETALLRADGVLLAATARGEIKNAERGIFKLEAPAVADGLIAAYGRLYAALQNGSVVCLEGAP